MAEQQASSLSIYLGGSTNNTDSSLNNGNKDDTVVIHAETLQAAKPTNTTTAPASLRSLQIVVNNNNNNNKTLDSVMNPMDLAAFMPLLKQDATVSFQVPTSTDKDDLKPLHAALLLAGLSCTSETKQADGSRVLTAVKMAPQKNAAVVPLSSSASSSKVVTIGIDATNDDDGVEDMIDEDALLQDNNLLAPPPAMSATTKADKDDCGGRKPCDNCTCGRADGTNGPQQQQIKTSSCGKCHLGDAFRCASCPYLGKPAFKPGEEHLVLDLVDDL